MRETKRRQVSVLFRKFGQTVNDYDELGQNESQSFAQKNEVRVAGRAIRVRNCRREFRIKTLTRSRNKTSLPGCKAGEYLCRNLFCPRERRKEGVLNDSSCSRCDRTKCMYMRHDIVAPLLLLFRSDHKLRFIQMLQTTSDLAKLR